LPLLLPLSFFCHPGTGATGELVRWGGEGICFSDHLYSCHLDRSRTAPPSCEAERPAFAFAVAFPLLFVIPEGDLRLPLPLPLPLLLLLLLLLLLGNPRL
jgi:hypothetical protein